MFVGAVKHEMGGIEMKVFQGEVGEPQYFAGDFGEDGVALLEESIEGTRESIVVEFVGGNVAEIFDAVLGGPLGNVHQGGGMMEPGQQQDAEDGAMGKLGLRIGGEMSIDDVDQVEFFDQGDENAKRADIDDGLFARLGGGEKSHSSSVRHGSQGK